MAESASSIRLRGTLDIRKRDLRNPDNPALAEFHRIPAADLRSREERDAAYETLRAARREQNDPVPSKAEFDNQSTNADSAGVFSQFIQDAGIDLVLRELTFRQEGGQGVPGSFPGRQFAEENQTEAGTLTVAEIRETFRAAESEAEGELHLVPVVLREYADDDAVVARRLQKIRSYVRQVARL